MFFKNGSVIVFYILLIMYNVFHEKKRYINLVFSNIFTAFFMLCFFLNFWNFLLNLNYNKIHCFAFPSISATK